MSGGLTTPYPGFATPASSGDLDLNKIGEARKSLVGVKLDQVCIFFPFGWLFCCSFFGFYIAMKGDKARDDSVCKYSVSNALNRILNQYDFTESTKGMAGQERGKQN